MTEITTTSSITEAIIETVIHEILTLLPNRNINFMCNYLGGISSQPPFYLVKEYHHYRLNRHYSDYGKLKCKLASNMFVIILPLEGIVINTTLDIIKNISGLSLWVTNPHMREKIIQFDIYNNDISNGKLKSPHIIVTHLPSPSLTLVKLDPDNTEEIITIYDLLMRTG